MTPENSDRPTRPLLIQVYRFLGGAAVGGLMLVIPLSLSPVELNSGRIVLAIAIVLICGTLSSIWGERFITAIMRSLDSSGY